MGEQSRHYQIQKMENDVKELKNGQKNQEAILGELKNGQKDQASILGEMRDVLKGIGSTIKNLSRINEKQIRQGADIESLKEDSKKFMTFMENSSCAEHTTEIKALTKSSDSKNNFAAIFISGLFLVLLTGLLTWMIAKG